MYCKKCGTKLSKNENFCTRCGAKVLVDGKGSNKSKRLWLISAIILLLLVFGGFMYNKLTNPQGVWIGNSNATILDIEDNGTGYFYQYGIVTDHEESQLSVPIKWKKIEFNKFQISYNNTTFDAKMENGKLVTENGANWTEEVFKKTSKSVDNAKADVQKYINLSVKDVINSPKKNAWFDIRESVNHHYISDEVSVERIFITQNGKSTCYYLEDDVKLDKLHNMTVNQIESYAKSHTDKDDIDSYRPHILYDPYLIRGRLGNQAYTGTASYSTEDEDAIVLKVDITDRATIPVFDLSN